MLTRVKCCTRITQSQRRGALPHPNHQVHGVKDKPESKTLAAQGTTAEISGFSLDTQSPQHHVAPSNTTTASDQLASVLNREIKELDKDHLGRSRSVQTASTMQPGEIISPEAPLQRGPSLESANRSGLP